MNCRVLVVDDHILMRRGLRSIISALPGFQVVGEAGEGREAIRQANFLKPDLVLMDIFMPGLNGIEATIQIKQRLGGETRVLMLTEHEEQQYVREALKAGADGYALKNSTYEEFVQALRSVAAGGHYIAQNVSLHLVNALLGHPSPPLDNKWDLLTSRERSILKLVAEGRTNRMVGEFLNISAKTVEKHRANLIRKLHLHSTAELVLLALEMGLIQKYEQVRPVLRAAPESASL